MNNGLERVNTRLKLNTLTLNVEKTKSYLLCINIIHTNKIQMLHDQIILALLSLSEARKTCIKQFP